MPTWGRMAVCTCGIMGRVRLVPVIMHRVRRVPQMLWRRVLQVDPERLVGMEGNDMVFLDIEIDGADAGRIEVLCPLFSPLLSLLSSLISPLFPLPEPAAAAHKSTGPAACGKGSCMEARAAQRETGLVRSAALARRGAAQKGQLTSGGAASVRLPACPRACALCLCGLGACSCAALGLPLRGGSSALRQALRTAFRVLGFQRSGQGLGFRV